MKQINVVKTTIEDQMRMVKNPITVTREKDKIDGYNQVPFTKQ